MLIYIYMYIYVDICYVYSDVCLLSKCKLILHNLTRSGLPKTAARITEDDPYTKIQIRSVWQSKERD